MNFIQKQLATLAIVASTFAPLNAQSNSQAETIDDSDDVSCFANISARNGYYFSIGPLAGDKETSKFVTQASFGLDISILTLKTWIDYAPLRGQIDEIDISASYNLLSEDFKIAKHQFNISGSIGIMLFAYPDGSQAGDATDVLPNIDLNLSTNAFKDKKSSLNLFYMNNVVDDSVQNGAALMLNLEQELGKIGPVSLSTNAYGVLGLDLYEFHGPLLARLGVKASVDLTEKLSLSADYSYQFAGPNQNKEVIPQTSIFGITLGTKF